MRITLTVLLLATIILSGCDGNNSNSNATGNSNTTAGSNSNGSVPAVLEPVEPIKPTSTLDPNFKSCNPYYPLVPGSQMKYTLNYSSGMVADGTVVVDAAEEDGRKVFIETLQIVDRSGGAQLVNKSVSKFICDNGRVQVIAQKSDTRLIGDSSSADYKYTDPAVFMNDPSALLHTGATWSFSFNQVITKPGSAPRDSKNPKTISYTVQGEEEVTVPAGKFKALKLLRKAGGNEITEYYVRGLGMVERRSGEGTVWSLSEYSGLTPIE